MGLIQVIFSKVLPFLLLDIVWLMQKIYPMLDVYVKNTYKLKNQTLCLILKLSTPDDEVAADEREQV